MSEQPERESTVHIIELDDRMHSWHDCGPGRKYITYSEDKSEPSVHAMVDRLLNHVFACGQSRPEPSGGIDG